MKRNGRTAARPWEPMTRRVPVPPTPEQLEAARAIDHAFDPDREVWANDRYTVHVDRRDDGTVECLSIKRRDRKPLHDWRHLQRIKNDIAGDEVEAVELYPAMSRLVDTADQYWLWCAAPGVRLDIGFRNGYVSDHEHTVRTMPGATQRPLEADWHQFITEP